MSSRKGLIPLFVHNGPYYILATSASRPVTPGALWNVGMAETGCLDIAEVLGVFISWE